MPRLYSEALAMRTAVSYILYATSYHEKTGEIITVVQFEQESLAEYRRNSEENE